MPENAYSKKNYIKKNSRKKEFFKKKKVLEIKLSKLPEICAFLYIRVSV